MTQPASDTEVPEFVWVLGLAGDEEEEEEEEEEDMDRGSFVLMTRG